MQCEQHHWDRQHKTSQPGRFNCSLSASVHAPVAACNGLDRPARGLRQVRSAAGPPGRAGQRHRSGRAAHGTRCAERGQRAGRTTAAVDRMACRPPCSGEALRWDLHARHARCEPLKAGPAGCSGRCTLGGCMQQRGACNSMPGTTRLVERGRQAHEVCLPCLQHLVQQTCMLCSHGLDARDIPGTARAAGPRSLPARRVPRCVCGRCARSALLTADCLPCTLRAPDSRGARLAEPGWYSEGGRPTESACQAGARRVRGRRGLPIRPGASSASAGADCCARRLASDRLLLHERGGQVGVEQRGRKA